MAPLLAQSTGVDRAFERLYRRHALDVYRYAHAVLRNPSDAEDVAQTTFMNAYRALERGDAPENPHNWLIAIAHNVCRQRFRQQSRRVQEVGLDVDVADTLVRREDDDAPTPEDIKRALAHLAFNQRAALVMREIEGRSYAEIADLLDLSVSAVETLIFRARRALREQLQGSLTCGQAELALSRQLDSELARDERAQLRAHLRECAACRRLARSQRAQRSAFRALGSVPLPPSLAGLFGGGGAAIATKAAAVVVAASVAGGVGYDVHRRLVPPAPKHHAQVVEQVAKAPATTTRIPTAPAVRIPITGVAVARPADEHSHRVRPHGAPHPAVPEPAPAQQPPAVADERPRTVAGPRPAGPTARAHPKRGGRQVVHGRTRRQPDRGHGGGHGKPADAPAAPPNPNPSGPPAGNGNPQSGKPAGKGNGGQGNPQDLLPTLPLLPSVPPAGDITQTSQTDGARNGGEWHLHP